MSKNVKKSSVPPTPQPERMAKKAYGRMLKTAELTAAEERERDTRRRHAVGNSENDGADPETSGQLKRELSMDPKTPSKASKMAKSDHPSTSKTGTIPKLGYSSPKDEKLPSDNDSDLDDDMFPHPFNENIPKANALFTAAEVLASINHLLEAHQSSFYFTFEGEFNIHRRTNQMLAAFDNMSVNGAESIHAPIIQAGPSAPAAAPPAVNSDAGTYLIILPPKNKNQQLVIEHVISESSDLLKGCDTDAMKARAVLRYLKRDQLHRYTHDLSRARFVRK